MEKFMSLSIGKSTQVFSGRRGSGFWNPLCWTQIPALSDLFKQSMISVLRCSQRKEVAMQAVLWSAVSCVRSKSWAGVLLFCWFGRCKHSFLPPNYSGGLFTLTLIPTDCLYSCKMDVFPLLLPKVVFHVKSSVNVLMCFPSLCLTAN